MDPLSPLSDRLPVALSATTAGNLLASALVNGDSHPDLVILAATIADESGKTVFLEDVRADLLRDFGTIFGSDGYMVVA